jgi:hypothetical protein
MRTLTMKEEKRLEVMQRVFRGELTMGKASLVLGVSERQCYPDQGTGKETGSEGSSARESGAGVQTQGQGERGQADSGVSQGEIPGL